MNKKLKVGIIGIGNIGTDLLYKISRSNYLETTLFMGRREDSKGISIAKEMGIRTSIDSIHELERNPQLCDLVFDATSAKTHLVNAGILNKLGKYAIDLTPARVGKMCVPSVNLEECLNYKNINMITCGGQGTIPIIHAIHSVQKGIRYVEIVASIAAKSAGSGTRQNIDEFTQTTKEAIQEIGGIENAKAIITLNPAEPPKIMHNTVFMLIDNPDIKIINQAVFNMEKEVQRYVPGYKIVLPPTYENGRVTTMVEVKGAGDYLPEYSGNLDIISCAAVRVAERIAQIQLAERGEIIC